LVGTGAAWLGRGGRAWYGPASQGLARRSGARKAWFGMDRQGGDGSDMDGGARLGMEWLGLARWGSGLAWRGAARRGLGGEAMT
jgi:hypothetical protein